MAGPDAQYRDYERRRFGFSGSGRVLAFMGSGNRRGSSGLTLLEIMVVLALIGIASSVVAPALSARMDRFAFETGGSRIIADLRSIQIAARQDQRPIVAVCREDQILVYRSGSALRTIQLPEGVMFLPPAASFVFSASGQVSGPPALSFTNNRGLSGSVAFGPLPGMVHISRGARATGS